MEKQEFYCVKCNKTVETDEWEAATSKSNRPMRKGKCPECGTNVCRFVKKEQA